MRERSRLIAHGHFVDVFYRIFPEMLVEHTLKFLLMVARQFIVRLDPHVTLIPSSLTTPGITRGCVLNFHTSALKGRSKHKVFFFTYIEDNTCPRVDMNFIFECSTRYLTTEISSEI